MALNQNKNVKLYYSIKEVAQMLDAKLTVLGKILLIIYVRLAQAILDM